MDINFLLIITISTSLVLFFMCIITIVVSVVLGGFVRFPIINFFVVSLYCLSYVFLIHAYILSHFSKNE